MALLIPHSFIAKFAGVVLLMCWFITQIEAQSGSLPHDEVEALREIAEEIGNKDWHFNVDPCNHPSWQTSKSLEQAWYNNSISCNCTALNGVCHVVSILIKGQGVSGVLPPSIVKLPHLKILDLYANYLTGSIPPQWASTSLETLSIAVNRLTGEIPSFLGNITSLVYLSIENNLFFGTVPPELGNLINLEHLVLNSNNLSGEIPLALSNMAKLTELISGNNFIGKIPSFIQSWKHLTILEIQGSGLEGPIPSSISALNNLTDLRISNLQEEGSQFPNLENTTNLKYLMLRNCNISGPLPAYVTANRNLKVLDVSFNRMSGNLPTNFETLTSLEIMYLTGNSFTGPIPNWIKQLNTRTAIDLSYNNFTRSSLPAACRETLNLFRSSSGEQNETATECLNDFPCSKVQYSVHINCGGRSTTVGSVTYEGDDVAGGSAKYVPTKSQWELSITGHYWDAPTSSDDYIAKNVSMLRMENSDMYTTARISPLSFTYYIRCLANGTYNVKLHFVEIIIRNDTSYQSLGRRIFDVYIQNKRVLKDFEIKKEAQGVDKVLVKEFTEIVVNDGTLDIHFRWAGKGTTHAPIKATYGPLVSAIDVKSEFEPSSEKKMNLSVLLLASILPLFFIFIVVGILWWKGCFGGKAPMDSELVGLDLLTGRFTFRQIKAATNNFSPENKIGEGGFGAVFKGKLSDGTTVAVKQLSSKSKQGNREFVNEIGMISALQHPNLVRLYGCCVEGRQLLLVYEYMENNSVAHVLFGEKEGQLHLDWPTRHKICIGIAKGLTFLHEESAIKIVHRDIKSTNVLLDKDLSPKISDFGMAKLEEEDNTHISTRVAGTVGYMAPEYALYGHLSFKADVYSFGIVLLEIVAGQNNMKHRPDENFICLLDWALVLEQKGFLMELVDPRLESKLNKEEVKRVIEVAMLCTHPSPALRPTMSRVVNMLEGTADIHELEIDPSWGDESRFNAIRQRFHQLMYHDDSSGSCSLAPSDALWNSSTSDTLGYSQNYKLSDKQF